jgi:Prokaryotic E2 family C/ThiF family
VALADYYARGAVAASQALQGGFEDTRFRAMLEATPLAIGFGEDANATVEGKALLDLTIRLAARLFPALQLDGGDAAVASAGELTRAINPNIELVTGAAKIGVVIGGATVSYEYTVYAGSDGWDALVSTDTPRSLGGTAVPFGAGVAACLAVAAVFRYVFLAEPALRAQPDVRYSTYWLGEPKGPTPPGPFTDPGRTALMGVGAIGNATAWALARAPITATIHIVDPETVELSNVQRYVLARRDDEGAVKVTVASEELKAGVSGTPHRLSHAAFLEAEGYKWDRMLLALDSARDRRSAQASLPRWIANAWTQPADLGVSVHPSFSSPGSCVACLYLQQQELQSEDELIADALNLSDQLGQVRHLLVTGEGLQLPFLHMVAERLQRPPELLAEFAGRRIRDLYVEGICGGAVLPLGGADSPRAEVHVPLAHQSALAGVLLAAAYARALSHRPVMRTEVARINVMQPVLATVVQPSLKRGDGRCLCEDTDFLSVYSRKYSLA